MFGRPDLLQLPLALTNKANHWKGSAYSAMCKCRKGRTRSILLSIYTTRRIVSGFLWLAVSSRLRWRTLRQKWLRKSQILTE